MEDAPSGMALLSVVHPVQPYTELLEFVREQIDGGRLEFCNSMPPTQVVNPTRELSRLISIFETELNVKFQFRSIVELGIDGVVGYLPIYSTCYVFSLIKNEEGGAFWFDSVRKVYVDGMTLLKCDDGWMMTSGQKGGFYLFLSVEDPDCGHRPFWSSGEK
ncbi:MAG: hypothetical protein M1816_002517 [Peltula sp. TS41687]|nr:MAG: hypothetical protein M1816_002517 [Peltula sp. TS41687]